MDDFTLVIKVRHGDTLRRFNANVVGKKLNINMNELTEKISHLFKFSSGAAIILSYLDEDGDLIALVDDDDLLDAVKQSLNPLRITVTLNDEKNRGPFTSTGTSPSISPSVQLPLQSSNVLGSEILKTIPEPLRETLVKLSTDLASKVSTATPGISPVVSELANYFSKVGLSYLNQLSETRLSSSAQIGVPENSVFSSETKNLELDPAVSKDSLKRRLENQPTTNKETVGQETEVNDRIGGRMIPSSSTSPKFNYENGSPNLRTLDVGLKNNHFFHDSELTQIKHGSIPPGAGLTHSWVPINGFTPKSSTDIVIPNSGSSQPASSAVSLAKSRSQIGGEETVFHRGVRCDVCRVCPILGPRFKSKVRVGYDLCRICFVAVGNEKDYIRMDHPAINLQSWSFKKFNDNQAGGCFPAFQQGHRSSETKPLTSKLDSRFIQDVNVQDGTVIAPLTPFTKIWRMRNNGTTQWPLKTRLVWIGGDKMSDACSVEVEMPVSGVAVDQELDIAVHFISPELPGRYVSYWKMASPSGQKFGESVCVLIVVENAVKKTNGVGIQGLNLNLPPVNSVLDGSDITNVDLVPPLQHYQPQPETTVMVDPFVQPLQQNNEQEMKFPITDNLLIGISKRNSTLLSPESISHPITDLPNVAALSPMTPLPFFNPLHTTDIPHHQPPPLGSTQHDLEMEEVEEILLKELEIMGFKHVDLNKDILRLHGYDLEKTVNYLFAVSE